MTINLDPQVFRDAAALINAGLWSCCCGALWGAVKNTNWHEREYVKFLADHFMPEDASPNERWWDYGQLEESPQEPRLIALLLCADILESEQGAQRKRKR